MPNHNRQSIRLHGHDYSRPGCYFLTICTKDRVHRFGEIMEGQMRLNELGEWAVCCWNWIPDHFPHSELDRFVIMPNHVHGIIRIIEMIEMIENNQCMGENNQRCGGENNQRCRRGENNQRCRRGEKFFAPTITERTVLTNMAINGTSKTIGSMVRGFKIGVTKKFNELNGNQHSTLWQRNYWERIVRNENELFRIRNYIQNNPAKWSNDTLNDDTKNMVRDVWVTEQTLGQRG